MYEYADITAYKPDSGGTHLKIFIPDRHLEEAIVKKRIKDCMVWLDDGRHISAEQRKKACAGGDEGEAEAGTHYPDRL